jgi:hypothetical protein
MKFRATLQLRGKTATGFEVPPDVVEALGPGKRPPVQVRIGDYTWRSTIAPYGGAFLLGVSAANRAGAGIEAGDEVDVEVELDTAPREVEVPAELAAALAGDAEASAFFEKLSYSHKRAYTAWISDAKKAETKQNRVAKAVEMLRAGKTR